MNKPNPENDSLVDAFAASAFILLCVAFAVAWVAHQ